MYVYVCMYECMVGRCMYVYMYLRMYVCVYLCICINVVLYIYVNTTFSRGKISFTSFSSYDGSKGSAFQFRSSISNL